MEYLHVRSLACSCIWFERYAEYMYAFPMIALLLCYFMAGCQTINTDTTAPTATEIAALPIKDCWPFRPHSIIVHPMSYFPLTAQGKTPMVAIYIECLDRDRQTTRSVGVLRLNVQDPISSTSNSCRYDLEDISVNNQLWDSVSRCYLIQVPLPQGFNCAPKASLRVSATLHLDNDETLTTQGSVNYSNHTS